VRNFGRGHHQLVAASSRNLSRRMERALFALGLVLRSVAILFVLSRGLVAALLLAPLLGAAGYYLLLRDWE
jgi:hypothetical protein